LVYYDFSAYEVQFNSFNLTHLREQDLKRMRRRVNEWRNEINASMARPPSWLVTKYLDTHITKFLGDGL